MLTCTATATCHGASDRLSPLPELSREARPTCCSPTSHWLVSNKPPPAPICCMSVLCIAHSKPQTRQPNYNGSQVKTFLKNCFWFHLSAARCSVTQHFAPRWPLIPSISSFWTNTKAFQCQKEIFEGRMQILMCESAFRSQLREKQFISLADAIIRHLTDVIVLINSYNTEALRFT